MSFGTKRAKDKLTNRLTRVYAGLFAAILLLLSALVFVLAFRFLASRQADSLRVSLELTADHIVEEIQEGESVKDPEVLEEQNSSGDFSYFISDADGNIVNRVLNFPIDEADFAGATSVPDLVLDREGRMLLCCAENIQEDEIYYGRLYMVQNLSTEQAFLELLALLLLAANIIGACAALLAGRATSRRMLSPIERMVAAANHIDEKNLAERLEVPEPDDELKNLALTINNMLDRVSLAYRQQGRFVADVSHELRTPLAVMQGNVDLLERWGSEDESVRQDCIAALGRQTEYMARLVENLLFLARCDNSRQELNCTTFPVREVFSDLLEEQTMVDTGHAYTERLPDPALCLTADRAMVKQLLQTLIDNSVKYTPEGGRIELACEAEGSGGVLLSVSDNGSGMSREHLDHVFDRFYRVDKARTKATGGMGLGLSIAAAIAEAHGGSIRAESEPDKRTTISVSFPAQSLPPDGGSQ